MTLKNDVQIVQFDVSFEGSLVSQAGAQFIDDFARFIDQVGELEQSGPVGVLLLQRGSRSDISADWLAEIKEDILLDELYLRIFKIKSLLQRITAHKSSWIYACDGSTLGLFFDLALSCDMRFCFRSDAEFGYPDIEGGGWPLGGCLEQHRWRAVRGRRAWIKEPVFNATRAKDMGFVDFVSDHASWEKDIRNWFKDHLTHEPGDVSSPDSQSTYEAPADPDDFLKAAFDAINRTPALRASGNVYKGAFDLGWSLLRSRPKQLSSRELSWVLGFLSAKQILMPSYATWLNRSVALAQSGENTGTLFPTVYIDLSYLAPPAKCLVSLVEKQINVVFIAIDGRSLKEALGLMYTRLERELGAVVASEIWTRWISWYMGDAATFTGPLLRWTLDDKVVVSLKGESCDFLRFLGNRSRSDCGWCEYKGSQAAPPSQDLLKLANSISEGVVEATPVGKGAIRLSTFARSLVLQEILRVCRTTDGGLPKVIEHLHQEGWGFVGEEGSWEPFLRARQASYFVEAEEARLGGIALQPEVWRLGLWKEVRELAKKTKQDESDWNPTSLSHHFSMLACVLVCAFIHHKLCKDERAANILVCQCLGFPEALGTPLYFARQQGRRKLQHYARLCWPHFACEDVWGTL